MAVRDALVSPLGWTDDASDFAMLDVGAVKDMPSFRVESLGRLKGTFFCRTGHPLTRQAVVTAEDLRKYSFVSTGLAGRHSAWIAEIDPGFTPELASANVALPAIAVSSFSFIYRIVEATDAIGVAHVSQLQAAVAQGRFALLKSVAKLPTEATAAIVGLRLGKNPLGNTSAAAVA